MTDHATRIPRWLWVSALITAILALALGALLLTGGGEGHGPGRHDPGADHSDGRHG